MTYPNRWERRDEEREPMARIYVASLSDYNDGRLHGEWIDLGADTDADEVWEAIEAMLASSPGSEPAEEFAIHDYEGFGSLHLGEHEPIDRVVFLACLVDELGEDVVGAYACHVVGEHQEFTADEVRDAYRGEFDSEVEFVRSLLIEDGFGCRSLAPDRLKDVSDVLDWEAIVTDLSDSFEYVRCGSRVLVFDRS